MTLAWPSSQSHSRTVILFGTTEYKQQLPWHCQHFPTTLLPLQVTSGTHLERETCFLRLLLITSNSKMDSNSEEPVAAAEPQQEPEVDPQASPQAATALQQLGSLYAASPTPSDEGGGGASPVKARMATRFFTPPTATTLAAGCCSTGRVPARSAASMQQLPSPPPPAAQRHLQDSIYSSSAVHRHVSAPALGKHQDSLLRHSQDLAGSHTSLVDVVHRAGTQVGFCTSHLVPCMHGSLFTYNQHTQLADMHGHSTSCSSHASQQGLLLLLRRPYVHRWQWSCLCRTLANMSKTPSGHAPSTSARSFW